MKGITDFITSASASLGQSEDQTREATGAILSTLKSTVADGDFSELMTALPGATDLLAAPAAESKGGLGGALGAMAVNLGASTSGTMGLAGMIQKTGFAPTKIPGLVKQFMELVKGRAGEGLLQKLSSQLPELATLAA